MFLLPITPQSLLKRTHRMTQKLSVIHGSIQIKNGGPDRRFKDNYEIPVCLYGELKIKSNSGMFFFLMTSKHDSPVNFRKEFSNTLK